MSFLSADWNPGLSLEMLYSLKLCFHWYFWDRWVYLCFWIATDYFTNCHLASLQMIIQKSSGSPAENLHFGPKVTWIKWATVIHFPSPCVFGLAMLFLCFYYIGFSSWAWSNTCDLMPCQSTWFLFFRWNATEFSSCFPFVLNALCFSLSLNSVLLYIYSRMFPSSQLLFSM